MFRDQEECNEAPTLPWPIAAGGPWGEQIRAIGLEILVDLIQHPHPNVTAASSSADVPMSVTLISVEIWLNMAISATCFPNRGTDRRLPRAYTDASRSWKLL